MEKRQGERTQAHDEGPTEDVLDVLEIEVARREPPARIDGVVLGTVAGLDDDGRPRIDHPFLGEREPCAASALVSIGRAEVGRAVAILFEQGNPLRPIVVGLMHEPPGADEAAEAPTAPAAEGEAMPERLVFEAGREVVIRCGAASITLTRAGRVVIRGAYVQSRASGLNRLQGASVKIN